MNGAYINYVQSGQYLRVFQNKGNQAEAFLNYMVECEVNAIMMIFCYLQDKMNFKDVRVSAHTFRHTFCHRLAMSGMRAFAIQKN